MTTEAFATLEIPAEIGPKHLANIRCKVDTGAGGNVMPLRAFAKLFPNRIGKKGLPTGLRKCRTRLTAYNGTNIPQLGALDTKITWKDKDSKQSTSMNTTWYVANTPGPAILGLPSCSRLGIVHLNCAVEFRKSGKSIQHPKEKEKVQQDHRKHKGHTGGHGRVGTHSTQMTKDKLDKSKGHGRVGTQSTPTIKSREDLIKAYPDRFEGIGRFPGTYHIALQDDAIPVVHSPRKCPIAMRPLVDEKLQDMQDKGIITPVTEPTDWVSSLAYSWKANGDLRVCLDPKDLNKAIRRDHYRTPTVEEITHELAGSTKFTKVDGSSSYHCIVLDYESSILTTFNTHRGRFRFVRLPFGLACAQDIFQRMMDQILDRCEGAIGIADDIVIHGKDDEEHDRRLHHFMRVATEHGLVLNKTKCEVKCNSVKFFGCRYDKQGVHPDPSKVSAIKQMPAPENKGELQSFLGMVTYLSPFIPSLSSHTAPLRGLLKNDIEYTWNATYQAAFDKLKSMVCEDTTLRYFDPKKPVVIQVDASGKGLGAALIQDEGPVAFASKALTPTEQRYANNERELLACVFGAERFRTYVFGRHFTIESDHKSLEQISMKNLADAPVRLQRMLLRLQDYDFTLKYRPGEEMAIADALSRYSPEDAPEIHLDISINHVYITDEKKQDYQKAIQDDPLLHALADIIVSGWPEDIKDVPKSLRPYHGQRNMLTVEDGIILRGEAIVIPPEERKKVLEQLHQGHLGISKCQRRAEQCVYWPGISSDIKRLVESCPTCQKYRSQEPRQPLKPTPPPERPWQNLGADFMTFDGHEYLVIVDYYSKMPIVRKMPISQCTAQKTISLLKELFAEHGIPESIRSDNGPQFASHLFKEFAEEWNFAHHTSSPTNPRSNGQAESAVKIVKGLLTRAKCSGEDPYLALLSYRSTPVDSHLRSPAEMLYQRTLRTTVPQRIRNKDPHAAAERERLEDRAALSAANHDRRGCRQKAPLFAGQTVSVLNNARTYWIPATVVRTADHGSYIVKVIGGGEYRRARDHIRERHPDAVKPDKHTPMAVTEPSSPATLAAAQPPVAPATPQPAAARSPTAAARTQRKTPAPADVPQKTGANTVVTPRRSTRVTKAPQRLITEM